MCAKFYLRSCKNDSRISVNQVCWVWGVSKKVLRKILQVYEGLIEGD